MSIALFSRASGWAGLYCKAVFMYCRPRKLCVRHVVCGAAPSLAPQFFVFSSPNFRIFKNRKTLHSLYTLKAINIYIYIYSTHSNAGVYILQNTMARGGAMVPGKRMKNEALRNKMKKKEKGERKKQKRKEKGESDFFGLLMAHFC